MSQRDRHALHSLTFHPEGMTDNEKDLSPLGKSVEEIERDNQNTINPPAHDGQSRSDGDQDLGGVPLAGVALAGAGSGLGGTGLGTGAGTTGGGTMATPAVAGAVLADDAARRDRPDSDGQGRLGEDATENDQT